MKIDVICMRRIFFILCLFLCSISLFAGFREDELLNAVRDKNLEEVEYLLSTMVDVNCTNSLGETPLIIACKAYWVEGVKLLLSSFSVNVNCTNPRGETPLIIACKDNWDEGVELLLSSSFSINVNREDKTGNTPLMYATVNGNYPIFKLLLKSGHISLNAQNNDGNTVAMLVAKTGKLILMKELINMAYHGIDWTMCNMNGDNILSLAIQSSNVGVVELLLENIAILDVATTKIGRLPALFWAIKTNNRGMVRCLLKYYSPNDLLEMTDEDGNDLQFYADLCKCEAVKNRLKELN